MRLALAVGAVSGVGAVARHLLAGVLQRRWKGRLPVGTMTVNVLGCLLAGVVTGLAVHHGLASTTAVVLSAGFCSGFSTWSTYIWEILALVEADAISAAAGNLLASLALGLAASAVGYAITLLSVE